MSLTLLLVQTLNGVQLGVLLFLIAAGLTLVFGVMDFINLAHGVQYMLGAYLAVMFYGLTGNFLFALILALVTAYVVSRRLVPWARALAFLCVAPFVIPGIVLAIGFYASYTVKPLVLYGTAWILILAFATRFLPIAYANSDAALRSINPEMEDAVRILGGGRLLALRKVVGPLLKRGLAGAFILVFIPATRELSSAIFLYTTGTQVLSVLLFDKSDEGNFELLSSIGLVLVVVTVALVMVGFRVIGRDFMLRRTST